MRKHILTSLLLLLATGCQSTAQHEAKEPEKVYATPIRGYSILTSKPKPTETFNELFTQLASTTPAEVFEINRYDEHRFIATLSRIDLDSVNYDDDEKLLEVLNESCPGKVLIGEPVRQHALNLIKSGYLDLSLYANGEELQRFLDADINIDRIPGILANSYVDDHYPTSGFNHYNDNAGLFRPGWFEKFYHCISDGVVESTLAFGSSSLYSGDHYSNKGRFIEDIPSISYYSGDNINAEINDQMSYWIRDLQPQMDRLKRKKKEDALFKTSVATLSNAWDERLNNSYKVGDLVCTYKRNLLGYVEKINGGRLKVLFTKKGEGNPGLFFGAFSRSIFYLSNGEPKFKMDLTTINEYAWVERDEVTSCPLEIPH